MDTFCNLGALLGVSINSILAPLLYTYIHTCHDYLKN